MVQVERPLLSSAARTLARACSWLRQALPVKIASRACLRSTNCLICAWVADVWARLESPRLLQVPLSASAGQTTIAPLGRTQAAKLVRGCEFGTAEASVP